MDLELNYSFYQYISLVHEEFLSIKFYFKLFKPQVKIFIEIFLLRAQFSYLELVEQNEKKVVGRMEEEDGHKGIQSKDWKMENEKEDFPFWKVNLLDFSVEI